MDMESKNNQLKRLREVAGLSQYQVAILSGIARNRLSLFECGYVQLKDEEYGLAERVIRDVLFEKKEQLRTALSCGRAAADSGTD
jgi:transcriptional regulator with XRE-family HTH domain